MSCCWHTGRACQSWRTFSLGRDLRSTKQKNSADGSTKRCYFEIYNMLWHRHTSCSDCIHMSLPKWMHQKKTYKSSMLLSKASDLKPSELPKHGSALPAQDQSKARVCWKRTAPAAVLPVCVGQNPSILGNTLVKPRKTKERILQIALPKTLPKSLISQTLQDRKLQHLFAKSVLSKQAKNQQGKARNLEKITTKKTWNQKGSSKKYRPELYLPALSSSNQ